MRFRDRSLPRRGLPDHIRQPLTHRYPSSIALLSIYGHRPERRVHDYRNLATVRIGTVKGRQAGRKAL